MLKPDGSRGFNRVAPQVDRRAFIGIVAAGGAGYTWFASRPLAPEPAVAPRVPIAAFDSSGRWLGVREVDSVRKSDAEWRKQLPLDSYMVTRRKDTELAFAGAFHNFDQLGLYRCIGCDTAVFDSKAKYASGTGWPAFTEPVAKENVVESQDVNFGLRQTEVKCARCWSHLGHLFDDGPPPRGLRYCINSVALRFVNYLT